MSKALPKKFKTVEELIDAYGELEKEFTKRCNLTKQILAENDSLKAQLNQLKINEGLSSEGVSITEEAKEEIIKEFLAGIASSGTTARLLGGGQAVRTPSRKPKSLQEANLMAKYFLIGDN